MNGLGAPNPMAKIRKFRKTQEKKETNLTQIRQKHLFQIYARFVSQPSTTTVSCKAADRSIRFLVYNQLNTRYLQLYKTLRNNNFCTFSSNFCVTFCTFSSNFIAEFCTFSRFFRCRFCTFSR